MKGYWKVLCFSMLAMPALASAADRLGCDSVNFGDDVLAKFPNAKAACIGVRRRTAVSTLTIEPTWSRSTRMR